MSGFVRNDWGKFLNGGQSLNFKYKDVAPSPVPNSVAASLPMTRLSRNKKGKKAIIGGKRKTRRNTKKRKHSRRK